MQATGNKSYHPLSLSIRLRADGFSFFVCDLQTSSLIRGEHFRLADSLSLAEQLTQELTRPDYFNRQIDQCFVLVCTPSTRVPLEEFHREEAAALYALAFNQEDAAEQRVAYNILPQLESAEIYAIPADVEEAVLQFYPTARFFASRAILMERLLLLEEDQPDLQRQLYVCSETDGYSLYAFDGDNYYFESDGVVYGNSEKGSKISGTNLNYVTVIDGVPYTYRATTYGKKEFHGSALPDVFGSFGANVSWKSLSLNAIFTYQLGGKVIDYVYQGWRAGEMGRY